MKKSLQENHIFYLILFILSTVFFGLMCSMANMKSLWMDDIAQIDISWQPTLSSMITRNIELDNNPPLTHFLGYFWLRIVPYGTAWLKLMNIILVSFAAYMTGIIGKELHSKYCGIIATVLFACNYGNITTAAYTFRPYGMFVLLGAVTFYLYLRSRKQAKRNLYHILFTISLVLLVYTHYFGVLLCIAYFCCDVYLVIKKRYKWYYLYSYPFTAITLFPWILQVIKTSIERLENFWPTAPSFNDLFETYNALMGYDKLITYLFILCFVLSILLLLFSRKKTTLLCIDLWQSPSIYYVFILVIPIIVFGIVFIYSNLPTTFSALFVYRYFICLVPMLTLTIAVPISSILLTILKHWDSKALNPMVIVTISFISILYFIKTGYSLYLSETCINQPFEEVAENLFIQNDINDNDVLVFNTSPNLTRGWDYYITHKSARPTFPVVWNTLENVNLNNYTKIYIITLHYPLTDDVINKITSTGFSLTDESDTLPIKIYTK